MAVLLSLLPPVAGCKLIAAPFLMWQDEPTKKVAAEFPHLSGKRVCILVWADLNTQFEYPHVRLELSEHIAAAMQGNVKGVTFVPNRQTVDYQNSNPDWDKSHPAAVGQRLGADRVLMVELSQYAMREPDSPHLYRGRIAAMVKVYDAAQPDMEPSYRAPVETVFPPDSAGKYGTSENAIRLATMEAFARDVAGKFHDRQVKVHQGK